MPATPANPVHPAPVVPVKPVAAKAKADGTIPAKAVDAAPAKPD